MTLEPSNLDAATTGLTLVATLAAAVAGIIYLIRLAWRFTEKLHQVADLLQNELTEGGEGGGLKDDVAAIAVAVGGLQRDLEDLSTNKELAHQLLQVQLDTVAVTLGLPLHQGTHRKDRQGENSGNPTD